MEELWTSAVSAVADREAAGLVVGGVGGAGDLAVGVTARHPGFEVVLTVGGAAEVAGTDVYDAVRDAQAGKDLLLNTEHLLVHRLRLLRRRKGEHLDLGELVDPVEAAARAAVGARLGAEAVGEACDPQGEVVSVQDLVCQRSGERYLGRGDERKVGVLYGVDLGLRPPRYKARPDKRLVAREVRGDRGLVAAIHEHIQGVADEPELEEDRVPAQEVELAPRDLRARLEVYDA